MAMTIRTPNAYKAALLSVVVGVVAGCGFTEEKYSDQASQASCEWSVSCMQSHETVDACIEQRQASIDELAEGCLYDRKAAKECVEASESLTCDDQTPPSICDLVYTCGGENPLNTMTPTGECETDDDCPSADSMITFANPDSAACTSSSLRGSYCSECINDGQCMAGFACRDATYCEELPPCSTGDECADQPGEVHGACISGFCSRCLDDADCEDDEICYSAQCATRSTVDPTCIDASCEGPCETEFDAAGVATGIACME